MSKKMFFKNMSKNVCQDNVCQDQVCQDHICQDHVCQLVLSTCFGDVNMLFQCPNVLSMSTYFVYMFCQHALSTSYDNVNMFCNMLQFSFIMNRISTNLEVKHNNKALLHFVAFFHVASLFSTRVENKKVGVDNKKALELTNSTVFHRGRQ